MAVLIIAGTRYPDQKDDATIEKIKAFNGIAVKHIEESIRLIGHENLELMISGACRNSPDVLIRIFHNYYDRDKSWFPADWDLGKRAGPIRNAQMAEKGTHLLAFWDGESNGTKNMISEAKKRNLEVRVVRFDYDKVFG